MKQTFLTFAAMLVLFASCKKEIPQQPSASNTAMAGHQPMAAKAVDNKKMGDYLTYENPEQTKVNQNMYLYLQGMQEVFKVQPSVLNAFYQKVKTARQSGLLLKKFINGTGNCAAVFNQKVCSLSPGRDTKVNQSMVLASEMTCQGMGYDPAIVLYNNEFSDFRDEYYLALMVEDNGPEDEGKEYVPALHIMADGSVKLELLDYFDAYYQSVPVFEFAQVLNADYDFMGGKVMAPEANTADPETFHPQGRLEPGNYFPPRAYDPGPDRHPSPVTSPDPKTVVHEGVNLYDHKEQIGASEYYSSSKVVNAITGAYVSENDMLMRIARNVVDCGCYQNLGNIVFFSNSSDVVTYSFITFEYDAWSLPRTYALGSGVTLKYKAHWVSDMYTVTTTANPAADFPVAGSGKTIINTTARHILRRY